jgi:quercetin dioxygenase-like cupin family protein
MLVRSAERGHIPSVDGVTLLTRLGSTDTAAAFVLLDVTLPPYWDACALHWHAHTTEMIYVLTGTLACSWGDMTTTAAHGTAILLPPGTVHTIWNPTATPATYLAWFTPGGAAFASTYTPDSGPASRTMLTTLAATDDVLLSHHEEVMASTRADSW